MEPWNRNSGRRIGLAGALSALAVALSACQVPSPAAGPGLTAGTPPVPAPAIWRLLSLLLNDAWTAAAPIGVLPFQATVDSTQATADPSDPPTTCGSSTGANGWYAFTPATTGSYEAWLHGGADVEPRLEAFDGPPSDGIRVGNCAQPFDSDGPAGTIRLVFLGEAGHTYYVSVGSDETRPGGLLRFELRAYEGFTLDVTADKGAGFIPGTGTAYVSGRVRVNKPCVITNIGVSLRQQIGRIPLYGYSSSFFGFGQYEPHPVPAGGEVVWSRKVTTTGTWSGGEADANVVLLEFNNEAFIERTIPLKVRLRARR